MNINRTSKYKIYISRPKKDISDIQRLWVDGLMIDMCLVIIKSDYTIGRKKLYETMINNGYKITSYVFMIHYEAMDYKSRSYIRHDTENQKKISMMEYGQKIMLMENLNLNILERLFTLILSI